MKNVIELNLAVRDFVYVAAGFPEDGIEAEAKIFEIFAECNIDIDESIFQVEVSDALSKRCGEFLDYFEISESTALVRSAKEARSQSEHLTRAQVEPLSTALVSASIIFALILAVRIAKIKFGKVEIDFYEGVPEGLSKLVEVAIPKSDQKISEMLKTADKNTK